MFKRSHVIKSKDALDINININKVLRNTYILLSITIFFSAIVSFLSIKFSLIRINPFLMLIIFFGLFYLINIFKNSFVGLILTFVLTGMCGYSLGPIINSFLHIKNGFNIVFYSLCLTGVNFTFLSLYVLISKKNFDFLNMFIMVGFFVAFISMIMAFIFNFPLLHVVFSGLIIIISSASILQTTSSIIRNGENNYILATISLYLSIYNILLSLLNIFGILSDKD